MNSEKLPPESFINTIIGEGTSFRGDMTVTGLLRIDGDFVGNVDNARRVLVGAQGRAKAVIRAREVVVGGALKGDIFATEKVTVLSSGLVIGNIYAPKMILEDGVHVEGYCCITPRFLEEGEHPVQPQGTYTLKFKKTSAPAAGASASLQ